MRNVPIIEGMRLGTGDDGYAEEFEEHIMLRLTPASVVEFQQMVLRRTGLKSSTITVQLGTIYARTEGRKGGELKLLVGKTCISMNRSTHLRVELGPEKAEVAVFTGGARITSNGSMVEVGKKQSLLLYSTGGRREAVTNGVERQQYDAWEQDVVNYHERHTKWYADGTWRERP